MVTPPSARMVAASNARLPRHERGSPAREAPASATSTFEPPPSTVTGNAKRARDLERLTDLLAGSRVHQPVGRVRRP